MKRSEWKSRKDNPRRLKGLALAAILLLAGTAFAQRDHGLDEIYGPADPDARSGGEAIVGIVYEPPALNPIHQQADATVSIAVLMYQGLVYTDVQGNVQPLLATDWEVSEDALTWRFDIRPGVTFHTGQPMTAEDVKYSYDYIRSSECGCAGSVYLNAIDEIVVLGEHEVEIRLSTPNSAILAGLDNKLSGIFPVGYWDTPNAQARLNDVSVGTGPFRLAEFLPNQSITLERFDDYWQPGVPYLDAVTFVSVPDGNSLLTGVRNSQIDLALLARPQDSDQLTGLDNVSIQQSSSWVQKSVDLQVGAGVTQDVRVRQAIALATDKEQILQAAVQGHGEVIGLLPAGMQEVWGVPLDELPNQTVDLDRARELLAEAGHADGLDIVITTIIGFDWMTPASETMAAQLERVGINATIQRQDLGVWIDNWGGRSFTDVTFNDWGTVPDPSLLFDAHFQQRPTGNDFRNWNSDDGTELLTRAKQARTFEERHAFYAEFQHLMATEVPTLPLFSSYITTATNDRLNNYVQHPSGWYFGLIRSWLD